MYKIKRFNKDEEDKEFEDEVFVKPKWEPKNKKSEDKYSPIKEELENKIAEIKCGNK